MASRRLTKSLIEQIKSNMCHSLFKKREEELKIKKRQLADAIYQLIYTDEEYRYMRESPDGAFMSLDTLSIGVGRYSASLTMSESRKFFYRDVHATHNMHGVGNIMDRYYALEKEKEDLSEERQQLRTYAIGVMKQITTVEKLLKVWPEVEEYIPGDSSITNLPTVNTEALNLMIHKLKSKL
jgi:hypothetical protein